MPKLPYEAALNRQQIAVAIVRAGAVVGVLAGLAQFAGWVIEGVAYGNIGDYGSYAQAMAGGTILLLGGAAGVVWARPIARLLLGRGAVDLCPGCDYQLAEGDERCPECGLVFAAALAPADRISSHDVLVRRRHLVRALLRLSILYILISTIWYFGAGVIWFAASFAFDGYDHLRVPYLASSLITLVVGLALAAALRLGERRLILWLTPLASESGEPGAPPAPDEP